MWMTFTLLLTTAVPVEDGGPAQDDLRLLQGVWRTEIKVPGETIRVEVENRGQRQTLRSDRGEQLQHEHVVDFELSRTGEVRVFRWKNGENVYGPRKGKEMPDGAFIYRLVEDRWTSVSGLLPGEEKQPVITQQFQKIAE